MLCSLVTIPEYNSLSAGWLPGSTNCIQKKNLCLGSAIYSTIAPIRKTDRNRVCSFCNLLSTLLSTSAVAPLFYVLVFELAGLERPLLFWLPF